MKKIKTYLIHLLGGVTKRELFHAHIKHTSEFITLVEDKVLPLGSLIAATNLKRYADSLNGIPADEWCKRMYDAISEDVEDYKKQFYKSDEHDDDEPEQNDTAHSEADQ